VGHRQPSGGTWRRRRGPIALPSGLHSACHLDHIGDFFPQIPQVPKFLLIFFFEELVLTVYFVNFSQLYLIAGPN
jgi:hypothetical protein